MAEPGFDPAAEFLLDMNWVNLFEPADQHKTKYRCKGCDAIISGSEREKHYNKHRGIRQRSETMRQARVKRERAARMAGVRAARKRALEDS